jgi:hypothetical protein
MTTTPLTKAAVDKAEPLAFPERKPARADLTITIRARIDGFDTEICFTGAADQLLAVTKRLREIGAEPVSAPASTLPKSSLVSLPTSKAKRVEPVYLEDGTPMCPTHGKELKEGKWGLFCSAKDKDTGEYCKLKFAE